MDIWHSANDFLYEPLVIPSSGLDLLDSGSDGLCPLASWTESHGAGLKTVSASDAVAILP